MGKKMLWSGSDHNELLTIFRNLVVKIGIKKTGSLIFSGCEGPCYSMATFLSFGIRDLDLNLYFVVESDATRMWKLEEIKSLGFIGRKINDPVMADVLVLMSGLVQAPLANTMNFVERNLAEGGIIIGETVAPGLFEEKGWDKKIPFDYLFEFSMRHPTAYEIEA